MAVERPLLSRVPDVEARSWSRFGVLVAAASVVSLGCDDETRCWEDGTCAGATSQPDGSVDTPSTSDDDGGSSGHAASSEASSNEQPASSSGQPTASSDPPTVSSEQPTSPSAPDADVPAYCSGET